LQLAATILAEELNFTRAADRLKITQPALSKQIIDLEKRIGFAVFKRDQKRIEITEAGQIFVRGCRDSLAIMEKALRLARATKDNIQQVITIGHSPYVDPALRAVLLSISLPLYHGLRLRLESMFAAELAHSVMTAELDLAIITEPSHNSMLTLVHIASAPLCVAMQADHPAAAKKKVRINDLTHTGWMIFPRKANPSVYDRISELRSHHRIEPVEVHHYVAVQEVIELIRENFGVAFVPNGLAPQIESDEIAVRPLDHEALHLKSYLVLRADESSRLVNEFGRAFLRRIRAASQAAGADPDQMRLDL